MENEVKEAGPKYNYILPAEYLQIERSAEGKNEYYDGHIYAMSGASVNHNRIALNLYKGVGSFLEGKSCEVFPSDLRVTAPSHDSYMYPDLTIVCGTLELQDDQFDTLLNPAVIIEILSPSTSGIDKGRKFFFYKEIPSLQEYIMIDSSRRYIITSRKQPDDSWFFENLGPDTPELPIQTIGFSLTLQKIYDGTGI